jgi:bud emergence protein 1
LKGEKRTSSNSSANGVATSPIIQSGLKSTIATIPPKKIIRALYDYTSQGPGELGFKKSDFLYVVGHEDDEDWYEACDPPSNLRGMVPVSYFEVVSRKETINTIPLSDARRQSHAVGSPTSGPLPQELATKKDSGFSDSSTASSSTRVVSQVKGHGASPLYGVVLYNFEAERQDELQASAGESIIVIAQSNDEWFVAKPIGRLGGPGLIPVSYVQIREVGSDRPVEDIQGAIVRAGVPKVEEWKRMAAEYKASSIPLGRFEDDASTRMSRQLNAMSMAGAPHGAVGAGPGPGLINSGPPNSNRISNGPYVLSASVDRYAFDGGRYWYLVVVQLSNGNWRNLCRYYQDFYDFQIKLLDEFPDEAGRTGRQRILPFMPGPLTYVNDSISSQRRANLDDYVRNLIMMPTHISRSPIVQQLFALRAGDIETPHQTNAMPQPPMTGRDSRASGYDESQSQRGSSRTSTTASYVEAEGKHYYAEQVQLTEVRPSTSTSASHSRMASESTVTAVRVDDGSEENDNHHSDGHTGYNIEGQAELIEQPTSVDEQRLSGDEIAHREELQREPMHDHEPKNNAHSAYAEQHTKQPSISVSRDLHNPATPVTPTAPGPQSTTRSSLNPSVDEGTPSSSSPINHPVVTQSSQISPPQDSSSSPAKSASPSKSDSVIKVKVHHEDDLIAIRVPSTITFEALLERITDRLQLPSVTLMHKEESNVALREVRDDDDLAEVLGMKNKLVLYAK